ncbi:hypothetical protein [Streptomyces prunicolor]
MRAPLGPGLRTLRGCGQVAVLLLKGEGLSLVLTPGQRADCTRFEAVVERIPVPRLATGRPPGFDKERSDERAYVYLGTVTAAALVIWLRS